MLSYNLAQRGLWQYPLKRKQNLYWQFQVKSHKRYFLWPLGKHGNQITVGNALHLQSDWELKEHCLFSTKTKSLWSFPGCFCLLFSLHWASDTCIYHKSARSAARDLSQQTLSALQRVSSPFSSGAELSHCEQRGKQSLFTNQLSSAPHQRDLGLSRDSFRRRFFQDALLLSSVFGGFGGSFLSPSLNFFFLGCVYVCFLFVFLIDGEDSTLCTHQTVNGEFHASSCGHGCVVIPGNVILILSHKSSCQEPKQP